MSGSYAHRCAYMRGACQHMADQFVQRLKYLYSAGEAAGQDKSLSYVYNYHIWKILRGRVSRLLEHLTICHKYLQFQLHCTYHILPVNSHGYYKFQLKIHAANNEIFVTKMSAYP